LLLDLHRKKFGDFLPLIRRQDVKGFVARRPIWLNRPLAIDATRKFAEEMEYETARFYRRAAQSARDDDVRDLLNKLAAAEDKHEKLAHELGEKITPSARAMAPSSERAIVRLMEIFRYSARNFRNGPDITPGPIPFSLTKRADMLRHLWACAQLRNTHILCADARA
jgi:erythrin-vacuolar iron transport family protein